MFRDFLHNAARKAALTADALACEVRIPRIFRREHTSGQLCYLSDEDMKKWQQAFLAMVRENRRVNFGYDRRDVVSAFPAARIEVVRKTPACDPRIPIVVLCVKNDLARLKMLVDHYRAAGVEKFAFLDNGSTDGTYEWMLTQRDIDVFRTGDRYSSIVKEAWITRIVSHYGFDRWYILTDSDELVLWQGAERHPVADVVKWAEEHGYTRLEALTLDMYADGPLFSPDDGVELRAKYDRMDSDSYRSVPRRIGRETVDWMTGGPRGRLMGVSTSLTKYPLVYFTEGTISCNAHFQYPYGPVGHVPRCLAILHYKFIGSDKAEFERRAAADSGFAFGGKYYRQYLQHSGDNEATFMYGGSLRLDSSEALRHIREIEPIRFREDSI